MSEPFIEDPDSKIEAKPIVMPDGVYLGLDEDTYHNATALGSSDMKRLAESPESYWWASKMNPMWEPSKHTPSTIYGRAVHSVVLEGRAKFDKQFACKTTSWATKEGKEEKRKFAERGVLPLPQEDYSRALLTEQMIKANKHLSGAFDDAAGYEVSVFWTAKGIPRKARFDALKLRAIVDLKNIANERGIHFPRACMRYIDNYSAHVQAEHYREGRVAMAGLIGRGAVFGQNLKPEQIAAICKAAETPEFAFVFVFVQNEGAPLVWGTKLSYSPDKTWTDEDGEVHHETGIINPVFDLGRAQIDKAEANYIACMKRYGTNTAWLLNEPLEELDLDSFPPWFLRRSDTKTF